MAIGAIIDLRAKKLKYDIRKDLEGKVDVLCYSKQPEAVTRNCYARGWLPGYQRYPLPIPGPDIDKPPASIDETDFEHYH
jgi:hypothetical protein